VQRLPDLDLRALTPAQRSVFDAIQQGPRGRRPGGVPLIGPYAVWVRAPEVGMATQALGAAVRFGSGLPEDLKEVSICTVGAYYRARFEFAAHQRLAIAAGVDAEPLERLRRGAAPLFDGDRALVYEITAALLEQHRLDDDLYRRALERFGEQQLIELVTIVGYYCLVSLTLNAFDVPLASGMSDPFPEQET
jgi:4-carboxymuconolactone decarboxylase